MKLLLLQWHIPLESPMSFAYDELVGNQSLVWKEHILIENPSAWIHFQASSMYENTAKWHKKVVWMDEMKLD